MKNCPVKKCLISVFAVFVFLNLYGMLVHGYLLMDDYKATANLWRTQAEMESGHGGWMIYYALLAMVFTCFFKKFSKYANACHCGPECACGPNCPCKIEVADKKSCCPIKSGGLCFGLKIGLIMGLVMASSYLYMPIPFALAVKWFIAGVVEGLGVGAILGMTCGGKMACAKTSCNTKGKE